MVKDVAVGGGDDAEGGVEEWPWHEGDIEERPWSERELKHWEETTALAGTGSSGEE